MSIWAVSRPSTTDSPAIALNTTERPSALETHADDGPEQLADDRRAHRPADHLAAALARRAAGQPRERAGPGEGAAGALHDACGQQCPEACRRTRRRRPRVPSESSPSAPPGADRVARRRARRECRRAMLRRRSSRAAGRRRPWRGAAPSRSAAAAASARRRASCPRGRGLRQASSSRRMSVRLAAAPIPDGAKCDLRNCQSANASAHLRGAVSACQPSSARRGSA